MTTKAFLVQLLTSTLIIFFILAGLAYYLYRDGYQYAEEREVIEQKHCSYLFGFGRSYIHFFEILGCKMQVEDRLDKLKALFGFDARNLSDRELRILLQQQQLLRYKRDRDLNSLLEHCNGDLEVCMEDTPHYDGYDWSQSSDYQSHTPLSPEECEEIDNAGFLPECRGW